jgi:hypothetical protein
MAVGGLTRHTSGTVTTAAVGKDDVVARLDLRHRGADLDDDTGSLVAEDTG